jgi:ferredoxin
MAAATAGEGRASGRARKAATLVVNPIECDGHGLCAELAPELITLDDWGFPIIERRVLDGELLEHARRAVAACPTLALRLRTP